MNGKIRFGCHYPHRRTANQTSSATQTCVRAPFFRTLVIAARSSAVIELDADGSMPLPFDWLVICGSCDVLLFDIWLLSYRKRKKSSQAMAIATFSLTEGQARAARERGGLEQTLTTVRTVSPCCARELLNLAWFLCILTMNSCWLSSRPMQNLQIVFGNGSSGEIWKWIKQK